MVNRNGININATEQTISNPEQSISNISRTGFRSYFFLLFLKIRIPTEINIKPISITDSCNIVINKMPTLIHTTKRNAVNLLKIVLCVVLQTSFLINPTAEKSSPQINTKAKISYQFFVIENPLPQINITNLRMLFRF